MGYNVLAPALVQVEWQRPPRDRIASSRSRRGVPRVGGASLGEEGGALGSAQTVHMPFLQTSKSRLVHIQLPAL